MAAMDPNKAPRAFTGTVTKIMENFGFVDDSVFFQLSVVADAGHVRVGDKVYVECQFSEHLPFKWNATKVHVVSQPVAPAAAPEVPMAGPAAGYGYGVHRQLTAEVLQYTSTPGAAFVTPLVPYQPPAYKSRQWEPPNVGPTRDQREDRPRDQRPERVSRPEPVERTAGGGGDDRRPSRAERGPDREPVDRRKPSRRASESPERNRRRYEVAHVPKYQVLKNPLTTFDIKQRYSPSLHVPSDLKQVVVADFELDVENLPKPTQFKIRRESKDKDKSIADATGKDKLPPVTNSQTSTGTGSQERDEDPSSQVAADSEVQVVDVNETSNDGSSASRPTRKHKYAVKVVLLACPALSDIYDRMFGQEGQDKGSNYFSHLNKLITMLVLRNQNDGISLIGGRWTEADGLTADGKGPDLVKTAVRVTNAQTGLNLTDCPAWKLLATFQYSRDLAAFDSPLELTSVFLADVWSCLDTVGLCLNKSLTTDKPGLSSDNISNSQQQQPTASDQPPMDTDEPQQPPAADDQQQQPAAAAAVLTNGQIGDQPSAPSNSSTTNDDSCVIDAPVDDPSVQTDQLKVADVSMTSIDDDDQQQQAATTTDNNNVEANNVVDSSDANNTDQIANQINQVEANDQQAVDLSTTANNANTEQPPTANDDDDNSEPQPSGDEVDVNEIRLLLSTLDDLKVADLRSHLEARGVKTNRSQRKADLVELLRTTLVKLLDDDQLVIDRAKEEFWSGLARRTQAKEAQEQPEVETTTPVVEATAAVVNETTAAETANETTAETTELLTSAEPTIEPTPAPVATSPVEEVSVPAPESEPKPATPTTADQTPIVNGKRPASDQPSSEAAPMKKPRLPDGVLEVRADNVTVVSLHEALGHQRYDQFELTIVSELLRESLIKHFAGVCLRSLAHNQKSEEPAKPSYVWLAFGFFDIRLCGFIHADDLNKLFSNAHWPLSKRTFAALTLEGDRVHYRHLAVPPPSLSSIVPTSGNGSDSDSLFNVTALAQRRELAERDARRAREELAAAKDKIGHLEGQIKTLESKQKRMTAAAETLNDEVCGLKRERDSLQHRVDSSRKAMESAVATLTEQLKAQKDKEN